MEIVIWIALVYYGFSILNYIWLRVLGYPSDYVRSTIMKEYYGE